MGSNIVAFISTFMDTDIAAFISSYLGSYKSTY